MCCLWCMHAAYSLTYISTLHIPSYKKYRFKSAQKWVCQSFRSGTRCCLQRYVFITETENMHLPPSSRSYLYHFPIPFQALSRHTKECREVIDSTYSSLAQSGLERKEKPLLLINGHPEMLETLSDVLDGVHFPEAFLDRIPEILKTTRERRGKANDEGRFITGFSVHSVVSQKSKRKMPFFFK